MTNNQNKDKSSASTNDKPIQNYSVGAESVDASTLHQEYLLNIVTDEMVCDSIRKSIPNLGLSNIIREVFLVDIKDLVRKEVRNILKDKNSKAHNLIQETLIQVNKNYFGNIQNMLSDTPVKKSPPKLAVRPLPPPIEM